LTHKRDSLTVAAKGHSMSDSTRENQMGFSFEKTSEEITTSVAVHNKIETFDPQPGSKPLESLIVEEKIIVIEKTEIATAKPAVYSVSEINSLIRARLEGDFSHIWLKGEISNFKPHTSGHFYFSLKDDGAQISAVMFKGLNSKLKFKPENGLEVLVRGKITVYEPRGNYQIFCETMEPVGAGALQKAFEQLKAKLQAEGLFDPRRKRALPRLPKHIGLVTSPTGAAIKDILNVLKRRYKSARITLAPALVQGDPAPASIVSALQLINKLPDLDVIIVGRGGGSIEDLWAFNDERVARAIAASRVPTISAVGHEVDFTIADFVADLRAPTPSAAAELVAQSASELDEKIQTIKARLWQAHQTKMQMLAEKIHQLSKRLIDPQRRLQDLQIRCDELSMRISAAMFRYIEDLRVNVSLALKKMGNPREQIVRLQKSLQLEDLNLKNAMGRRLDNYRSQIKENAGRLDAMSPLRVVERGYSIVETAVGIVKSTKGLKTGDALKVRMAEGAIEVEVTKVLS
jgi:exodeoxyribonuclease VII large subunit